MTEDTNTRAKALVEAAIEAGRVLIVLEGALRAARAFIAAERDVQLAGAAEVGPDGQPDRSTIAPDDLPTVLAFDAALAAIDAALLAASPQP